MHYQRLLWSYSNGATLTLVETTDCNHAVTTDNGVSAFWDGDLLRSLVGVHDADDVVPRIPHSLAVESEGYNA